MAGSSDHVAAFRQEAAELMAQLEATLLDMEATPDDRALVDSAFRALHTLKGSGAMFGFDALAAFTHGVENAFDLVRSGQLTVSKELIDITLGAMDHIRALVEAPDSADPARGDSLLAALRELTGQNKVAKLEPRRAQPGEPSPTVRRTAPEGGAPRGGAENYGSLETWRIRFRPGREVLKLGTNPLLLLEELGTLGHCTVTMLSTDVPPLEELDAEGCYLGWDIILTTDKGRAAIEDVFIFVADQSSLTIEPVHGDLEEAAALRVGDILVGRGEVAREAVEEAAESVAPIGAALVARGQTSAEQITSALREQQHLREAAQAHATSSASVRVPAERLDALMDQVGELVIAQARLAQISGASTDLVLKSVAEEIGRLASELRDTTMGIRMVPIGTLFNKFRRVVRDLSKEVGKQVELTMSGEDTELDKTMIESLNDPLVHLIRNAIDHGIESAEERQASGKAPIGRVHLAAVHAGAQVLITVMDDGRGMNRRAIRAKAEERGMVAPGQEISDSELLGFVFHPGFSTNRTVTNISGRGVGMDVVRRAIDGLRGSVEVASEEGSGSTITCKVPLTLAIIDGLLVRLGDSRYVVPLSAVEECVELTHEQDVRSRGRSFLDIRGGLVPFLRLRELFDIRAEGELIQKVVIVASNEGRVGLAVDQVIGQYQTVIKSLSKLHEDVEEFSGATILGDGTVALILDIPHLIAFAQEREMKLKAS